MKLYYLCRCKLRPEEHQVLRANKVAHKLELQRIEAQQVCLGFLMLWSIDLTEQLLGSGYRYYKLPSCGRRTSFDYDSGGVLISSTVLFLIDTNSFRPSHSLIY